MVRREKLETVNDIYVVNFGCDRNTAGHYLLSALV